MANEIELEQTLTQEEVTNMQLQNLQQGGTLADVKADMDRNDAIELKRHKLELLRTAKETLVANKSNAPIGERVITDVEIVNFAITLEKYLTS